MNLVEIKEKYNQKIGQRDNIQSILDKEKTDKNLLMNRVKNIELAAELLQQTGNLLIIIFLKMKFSI